MSAIIGNQPLIGHANNGRYQITGTAQRLGVPAIKRVRLYFRAGGHLFRETFSAADGAFAFTGLAGLSEGYVVMVLDDESRDPWLDPDCADRVTPELMP